MADARNSGHMIGRLGADPEYKMTPKGVALASFRIAVNDPFDKNVTYWFTGVAWRQNADYLAEYCAKGNLIAINYHLKTEEWKDERSGEKRTTVKLEVEAVTNLSPRGEDDEPEEKPAKKKARVEEDEDEAPAKKKKKADTDEPKKKRRVVEEEEDDEDEEEEEEDEEEEPPA